MSDNFKFNIFGTLLFILYKIMFQTKSGCISDWNPSTRTYTVLYQQAYWKHSTRNLLKFANIKCSFLYFFFFVNRMKLIMYCNNYTNVWKKFLQIPSHVNDKVEILKILCVCVCLYLYFNGSCLVYGSMYSYIYVFRR